MSEIARRIGWNRARFADFHGAALQTIAGYVSAALGLLCEIVIALHHGASATTDLYRWVSLAPFYLGAGVGAILAPVFFRGRLVSRGGTRGLIEFSAAGRPAFVRWARVLWVVVALTSALCALASTAISTTAAAVVLSFMAGAALLTFSVFAVPLFYYGHIWVFVAANGFLNAVLVAFLTTQTGDFAGTLAIAFGVFTFFVLGLCIPLAWSVRLPAVSTFLSNQAGDTKLGGTRAILPVLAVHICSIAAVVIYFRALSLAGGGLLSVYSLTQKVQLLLAVPGAALANKYLRDQASDHSEGRTTGSVTATVRAVLPLLLIAPLFGVGMYGLLCGIYHVDPSSALGERLAPACGAGAGMAGVSLCASMLPLARTGGRQMIYGAVLGPVVAAIMAVAIGALAGSTWSVSLPFVGAGVTGILSLIWMASRTGEGLAPAALLFGASCILAGLIALALTNHWLAPLVSLVRTTAETIFSHPGILKHA